MNEADILATTYYDTCVIYRKGDPVKDENTRQSHQETVIVAQDVACALSTAKGGNISLSGGHGSYDSGYTLFCRPDVDVRMGDKLVITQKSGQVYTLWAGRPFTYDGSHTETPLSEEERK